VNINNVKVFVFDFDGVLTNNMVNISEGGAEFVTCNRADGLAFDVLRKLKKPTYILSTEKNNVVRARANKLRIPFLHGVENKLVGIQEILIRESCNIENVFYVGNDLNDFKVMMECGISGCPADSHLKIKQISDVVFKSNGGDGVIRELLEDVFNLDFLEILYKE
jgi:3-deoxy-D-manno-octulosonate 8-phosphate phosphatase (KDO 8-P phosphatase)